MRVLYIDVDTLKLSHLGCHGYSRKLTPNIDALASEGVRFEECYCSDSPCVPSRAALVTGRLGINNGVVSHEDSPAGCQMRYHHRDRRGHAPTLAHHLLHHGYSTAVFSSFANRHLAGWFYHGFEQCRLTSLKNGNEDAHEVLAAFDPWLQQNAKRDNWFVHLNFWDPHTLYTEPREWFDRAASMPAPEWPDSPAISQQQSLTGIRTPRTLWADESYEGNGKSIVPTMPDQIASRDDFVHLINGYDGAIAYLDHQLGILFQKLKNAGVYDETIIIISADHGETFGQHGQYGEHGCASRHVQQVPLIIRWPGVTDRAAGEARRELLYQLDLLPTLAEGLGLPAVPGWDGQSFFSLLSSGGDGDYTPRQQLIWGHGLHSRQRAVYDGRYLFLRTYHPGYFEFPPRLLFDTQEDVNETCDLLASEPGRARVMEAALCVWEDMHTRETGMPDPMMLCQEQPPFNLCPDPKKYLRRLHEQGRARDAQRLALRLTQVPDLYAHGAPTDGKPFRSPGTHPGMTLVELLAALAVVAILILILIASIAGIRRTADGTVCVSNLRQISAAIHLYAAENAGRLPGPLHANQGPYYNRDMRRLQTRLVPYLGIAEPANWATGNKAMMARAEIFACPAWWRAEQPSHMASLQANRWIPRPNGSGNINPFGAGDADGTGNPAGINPPPMSLAELDGLGVPLSDTWLLIESDAQLSNVGNATPHMETPIHRNFRTAIFLDGRIGRLDLNYQPL